jgi:hypothetical protein
MFRVSELTVRELLLYTQKLFAEEILSRKTKVAFVIYIHISLFEVTENAWPYQNQIDFCILSLSG